MTEAKPGEPVLNKDLLTPDRVVALIPGLKLKLLAEWRYKKTGPRYYKVGRIILYPFDDLEVWFEGLERGGDPDD
ncbi:hypothetical protein [Microbacterium trichothecenolyticum]|uniref:Helix-turn-helix domain protein n=2 Tax=Microbacteriaceae TaxID=85023 RepID=A0A0M2HKS0_MICTR|nr:hypothetical protein [Microbacterium trichothecenolyticum]KJL44996.1 hypothetical protein RS82_00506 [Microbacterium trichothecenolyticum]